MSKRIKIVTLSCVTVLCCLAFIVAGTYALYSDSTQVTNHLQAGELNIKLYRDKLTSAVLNDSGILELSTNNARTDFTNVTTENVFGLTDGVKIAPGSKFEAVLTLDNVGDVAVNYYLEFKLGGDVNELAQQLRLTLSIEGKSEVSVMLSELGKKFTWGSENSPLGQVALSSSGSFVVALEFVDNSGVNNDAQGQEISFDLIVHAVQATA